MTREDWGVEMIARTIFLALVAAIVLPIACAIDCCAWLAERVPWRSRDAPEGEQPDAWPVFAALGAAALLWGIWIYTWYRSSR